MTTTLDILGEIAKELAAITDTDVRRVERKLGAARDKEKALGTIHNVAARRAWALAEAYEARAVEAAMNGKFKADSDEQQQEYASQMARWSAYEKIARDLFWLQAKEDIGGDAWRNEGGVGLRSGWMLVACSDTPIDGLLARLIGGGAL